MFVGCQWVFTTFVLFWKVLWVWSGFLGKVLEEMLVRVWGETIADTPVQEMILFLSGVFWEDSWVWSGSVWGVPEGMLVRVWEETIADTIHCWEMFLSLFWFPFLSLFGGLGAHQGVWSGFLVRFMGNMIRIAWEETTTDHPLKGIAVRIGFRNLNLGVWILGLGFWILEFGFLILVRLFFFGGWILKPGSSVFWGLDFGVLILGVWILEVLDCWFPSFVFGRFYGSEVVSLGRFWRRCLWESEGKPSQTSSPGNDLVFVRCFLGRFMGLKWFGVEGSGGDACESLGGNHCRHHPLLGNVLEFVLVPVSIFVRWFGRTSRGLKWFPCEIYGKHD